LSPSVCEEKIYNEIYRSNAESLRNHLYYKFGDIDSANDLVQDAFLKLWTKCSEVVYEKAVNFLYVISKNLAIDKIRSKKVALKFEKGLTKVQDNEDPYFHLRTKEFKLKIEATISNLPEKQREAFLLNRIDKLTYKEIANRLGVSETAIEKRISKALIKLKSLTELQKRSI